MVWLKFAFCAAVIFYCGSRLSHYAELIADKSGISKGWIGLVLLAMVTSLSELVTSLSANIVHNLPDMAVGGLIGACMVNAMLIGLLDVVSDRPVSYRVHDGHLLSAGFCIILIGFVAIDILFGQHLPVVTLMHTTMDPITILFVPVYLLAMKLSFEFEKSRLQEYAQEESKKTSHDQSWVKLVLSFGACGIGIVCASYYLPEFAQEIAKLTGWGASFIGSSLIATATCLPELIVSITAARSGAFDMAVASLLGSNLCNIVILAINDLCYPKEPILRHASTVNTLAALTAMISMGIVVVGLTYRSEKKVLFMAGDAAALIFVYVLANILLFVAH